MAICWPGRRGRGGRGRESTLGGKGGPGRRPGTEGPVGAGGKEGVESEGEGESSTGSLGGGSKDVVKVRNDKRVDG